MTDHGHGIQGDLAAFKAELAAHGVPYQRLLRLSVWRPIVDIAIDWIAVLVAVWMVSQISLWFAPLALVVIGNRQRALGNILHDGGHGNVCRLRAMNDTIVNLFVAPLLFVSLSLYREDHWKHHRALGHAHDDPDFLPVPQGRVVGWWENYLRNLLSAKSWRGSVLGHLCTAGVAMGDRAYIAAWWLALVSLLATTAGVQFAAEFVALWLAARATAFHVITVFREMCDHFGLAGSVVCSTRDIVSQSVWTTLVHPHNNGYHLTHHLLPAVPYYRLPEAQRLFADMPMYGQRAPIYASYVFGKNPVVTSWETGART